jgi:hypothetical protein
MSDAMVIVTCTAGIAWALWQLVSLERLKRRCTREIAESIRRFEERR